jgi:single-stranded-DNA-specific exonuclease
LSGSASTANQPLWVLPDIPEPQVRALATECGLRLPVARVLWSRGYRDAHAVEQFRHPRLNDLCDPGLLSGMQAAVERLQRAVRDRERILVYGDYDVDGVCSVVLLKKMLQLMGHDATHYVPHRLKEGYGMQTQAIEDAARDGVTLIVSVDTGIRALQAVADARARGIDVIITDHHLPEAELPPANAILNPNQDCCSYPNKNLCGAGVTFKLVQALMEADNWAPDRIVRFTDSFLVMVALATVADVVPLVGENRIIVKRGLDGLSRTRNPGLRALLDSAHLLDPDTPLSASDIGFRVAPRINAAGRMEDAGRVIELLLTSDELIARTIAADLDGLNVNRQEECEKILREIREAAGDTVDPEQAALVFYHPDWHRGVVGIVASRIVELFHRPVVVLGRDEKTGLAQGSGRSIPSFHLLGALEACHDLLTRYGGHRQAAGVTLEVARVEEFRARLNQHAREALSDDDLRPVRHLDAELSLAELDDQAAEQVLSLAPFGLGNRAPVFLLRNAELRTPPEPLGRDGKHLRFFVHQGDRRLFLKAWRMADRAEMLRPGTRVDVAVSIETDNYGMKRGFSPWGATAQDVRTSAP